jgi:uncharacterized membrane protein
LVRRRPSGAENFPEIDAESFQHQAHLDRMVSEAQRTVNGTLASRRRRQAARSEEDGVMTHLWAISFADPSLANQLRDRLFEMQAEGLLSLEDLILVRRRSDGSFEIDQEVFEARGGLEKGAGVGFIVAVLLAVAGPAGTAALAALGVGPIVGAVLGGIVDFFRDVKIDPTFVRQVEEVMKPGASVVFLLDRAGGLDRLLPRLHGLGGEVLRTNVDVERARQIQAALLSPADPPPSPEAQT